MEDSSSSLEMSIMSCSFHGIVTATTLVLLTTLDDVIWLVPMVTDYHRPGMLASSIIHAMTFVLTLVMLASILCFGTWLVMVLVYSSTSSGETPEEGIAGSNDDKTHLVDTVLGITGTTLCWILAGFLVYKRWRKRRRKREQEEYRNREITHTLNDDREQEDYGTIPVTEPEVQDDHVDDDDKNNAVSTPKPMLVISLTFLGFLDELAYFPSLILGRIFSIPDLCLGTFLAGLLLLAFVTIAMAPCRPCIDWLDQHLKLYMVVILFAIILTVRVALEAV